ncbi:MAG: hypothetical protein GY765_28260 [bacterium]|nr:hypothetical protein [bacterium]
MSRIKIEGVTIEEILQWPESQFDDLVLIDKPIAVRIGTGEVLGQFAIAGDRLVVELAHIEGGGEGVLPAVSRVAKHIARLKQARSIECVVHALSCARPNPKLRAFLEKTGFEVKHVEGKGEAYYKEIPIA